MEYHSKQSAEPGEESTWEKVFETYQRKRMEEMDEKIGDFMRKYESVFGKQKPVGKLSAYFSNKDEIIKRREESGDAWRVRVFDARRSRRR